MSILSPDCYWQQVGIKLEMARKHLPKGYGLNLDVRNNAYSVILRDPDDNMVELDHKTGRLHDIVDLARKQAHFHNARRETHEL